MKCPKCGRDTYSKKWGNCTACGGPGKVGGPTPDEVKASTFVTPLVAKRVTPVMGRAEVVTSVIGPGEECPTCHRKMPSKAAMKQAAWREKREA